jgi:hypothetical protein
VIRVSIQITGEREDKTESKRLGGGGRERERERERGGERREREGGRE